ncbi:hypothetical protein PGH07_01240 [Sulfurovum sp. zt1-1]|uniref:Uncharacterized protein n=1 Tax=Sulfurovum zhangzhouensis TaxID=3019067 RepID=A0ABT7QVP0_9BACT|nr:hypothetical protein [Sulfurovum zhangzhouensis]MDM5270796.1 hypothetical protein [Sulfurovum zhangzhouensis]
MKLIKIILTILAETARLGTTVAQMIESCSKMIKKHNDTMMIDNVGKQSE